MNHERIWQRPDSVYQNPQSPGYPFPRMAGMARLRGWCPRLNWEGTTIKAKPNRITDCASAPLCFPCRTVIGVTAAASAFRIPVDPLRPRIDMF
jgi:hypothetical protein